MPPGPYREPKFWSSPFVQPSPEQLALTVPQAATLLGVPRFTIYKLVRTGKIRFQKLGKRHLIHRGDLSAYIDQNWRREGVR